MNSWHNDILARAGQHRRVARSIRICNQQGQPLRRHPLQLSGKSDFAIGSCVGRSLLGSDIDGERQRSLVRAHFPLLVCENAMKWYATEAKDGEEDYQLADQLLDWSEKQGHDLRGHCLFWEKEKFQTDWVKKLSKDQLWKRLCLRLESILNRYRGRVCDWDMLNEMLDGDFFASRLGTDGRAAMFRQAHAIDPTIRLFTNEYGILDSDQRTEQYRRLIDDLRAQGAPIGGIGIQEHAAERFVINEGEAALEADRPERQGRGPLIPDEIWRRLDFLAETGLPIHFTEISIATADKPRAARAMDLLLGTAFAHPAVECCLFWGFEARNHWLGDAAALVDRAGRPFPAMLSLSEWQRQWSQQENLVSDDQGCIEISAWQGNYTLSDQTGQVAKLSLKGPQDEMVHEVVFKQL
ncbi:MAG: hypothetical protein EA402_07630 [Planctomycetota bacterium]|nr:MAG: hypothetical protein EA402_07630 [Planctomycetota bacterium]